MTRTSLASLTREEASSLLRKRLMTIGGLLGAAMGVIWIVVALIAVPGFPDFGSAPFLMISFLSVLLLAAAGMFAGRRVWKRSVSADAG